MPRYFFHLQDGGTEPDEEGQDFPDWLTAKKEALIYAGELLRDEGEKIAGLPSWQLTVADAAGATVFSLSVSALAF